LIFRLVLFIESSINTIDAPEKSPSAVMPDLIRHPEVLEFTGFLPSPE